MFTKPIHDAMLIDGEIRYGTSLHRVNEILENNLLDEEFAEFYAGDLRDVCGICDAGNESAKAIRERIKAKPTGEVMNVPLAEVRLLVAAAQHQDGRPSLKSQAMPKSGK